MIVEMIMICLIMFVLYKGGLLDIETIWKIFLFAHKIFNFFCTIDTPAKNQKSFPDKNEVDIHDEVFRKPQHSSHILDDSVNPNSSSKTPSKKFDLDHEKEFCQRDLSKHKFLSSQPNNRPISHQTFRRKENRIKEKELSLFHTRDEDSHIKKKGKCKFSDKKKPKTQVKLREISATKSKSSGENMDHTKKGDFSIFRQSNSYEEGMYRLWVQCDTENGHFGQPQTSYHDDDNPIYFSS